MVGLASPSGKEVFFANTSQDEELARKLFDDLNRNILGPPGDGKIIVLSDSDDEVRHMRTPPSMLRLLHLLL
jgi:hypothetical protein